MLKECIQRLEDLYYAEREVSKSYELERIDESLHWTFCKNFDAETAQRLERAKSDG